VEGGGGGNWCGCPGQQSQRGSKVGNKMNNLNEKFYFLHSAIFKVLRNITGNTINGNDS
jgi:hypothetical protein